MLFKKASTPLMINEREAEYIWKIEKREERSFGGVIEKNIEMSNKNNAQGNCRDSNIETRILVVYLIPNTTCIGENIYALISK